MKPNLSERRGGGAPDNRFTRHPVATMAAVMIVILLVCLLAAELFLRMFTGLGNPALYELSPLYGYRLRGDQVIEPRGGRGFLYGARLTTNNLGLRAAAAWDSERSGKILFLGDSVTYGGQYVADGQLFTSVAGSRLPDWQVGNGGVNGWGVENMVGLVKGYGFSPAEVVVTCVIEGDFYRGLTRASAMPLWTERPKFALQHLLMHALWRANRARFGFMVDTRIREEAHLDRIVDRAAMQLKDLDGHLGRQQVRHVVFILPTRTQVVEGAPPDPRVRRALERYGIGARYLLPELLDQEPDRKRRWGWFQDEVHLEPSGHRVYGELIGKSLADLLGKRRQGRVGPPASLAEGP